MGNHINSTSEAFFCLLNEAGAISIDNGALLTDSSEIADISGDPENEVIRFSWSDGEIEFSEVLTEGGIAKGIFDSDGLFHCENKEGEKTVFSFFALHRIITDLTIGRNNESEKMDNRIMSIDRRDSKNIEAGNVDQPFGEVLPAYNIGQRFPFMQGDRIIGNGYAGSVVKVCDGQLTGMIEVRLPGGVCCVSASYPDCYPATYKGVEIVTDGRFVGKVDAASAQFVVQSTGRGKQVIHEAHRFDTPPKEGDMLDVKYNFGKLAVTSLNINPVENER